MGLMVELKSGPARKIIADNDSVAMICVHEFLLGDPV
jgi:hypothetical protein